MRSERKFSPNEWPALRRRRSDAELRARRFRHDAPETVAGYCRSKPPDGVVAEELVYDYKIPGPRTSRDGYVWCCYCGHPTHRRGGLFRYSDGALRTVGWKCNRTHNSHFGLELEQLCREFSEEHRRLDLLMQFDYIGRLLPEVIEEIGEALRSRPLATFMHLRNEFREKFQGLHRMINDILADNGGEITWEERIADYSRTALRREAADGDDSRTDQVPQRQAGERVTVIRHSYPILGTDLVDDRHDPEALLRQVIQRLEAACEFYGLTETDSIEDGVFRHSARSLEFAVTDIERVQRWLATPKLFFSRKNREMLVAYRNSTLQTPMYHVTDTGFFEVDPLGGTTGTGLLIGSSAVPFS